MSTRSAIFWIEFSSTLDFERTTLRKTGTRPYSACIVSVSLFAILFPLLLQAAGFRTVSSHEDAEKHYRDGVRLLLKHNLGKAEASFLKALSFDPNNGKIHWETGWVYWQKKNWKKTMHHWNRTRELTPQQKELDRFYRLAEQYLKWERQSKQPDRVYRIASSFGGSEVDRVSIVAVGDIMMGSDFKGAAKLPPHEGRHLLEHISSSLIGDIVFGNLEGPLTRSSVSTKCKKGGNCYIFRTPVHYARNLKSAGFTVVNIANNHIMDFGPSGVEDTLTALSENGIAAFGHIAQPRTIIEANGIKVGFYGVSTSYCCLHINQLGHSKREVNRLKNKTDIVVVSFHAGAEGLNALHTPREREYFFGEDRGEVREFAHRMIDAGADLVLGHGPHTLRGIELYKGKAIAYSLGNFLGYLGFNVSGHLKYSMIFQATIEKTGKLKEIDVIPIALNSKAVPKIDPKGTSLFLLNDLSRTDFSRNAIILDSTGHWQSE